LYIGQGDYRVGEKGPWRDPAQLDRQLTLNARYAVDGSVHFSAKQIRADRLRSVTLYREHHYAAPALLPPMARLPVNRPTAPRLVSARRAASGTVTVDWQPGPGPVPAGWALYLLDGPVAKLVATGRTGTAVTGPASGTYCVSGLDRSGNEGPPSAPLTA